MSHHELIWRMLEQWIFNTSPVTIVLLLFLMSENQSIKEGLVCLAKRHENIDEEEFKEELNTYSVNFRFFKWLRTVRVRFSR